MSQCEHYSMTFDVDVPDEELRCKEEVTYETTLISPKYGKRVNRKCTLHAMVHNDSWTLVNLKRLVVEEKMIPVSKIRDFIDTQIDSILARPLMYGRTAVQIELQLMNLFFMEKTFIGDVDLEDRYPVGKYLTASHLKLLQKRFPKRNQVTYLSNELDHDNPEDKNQSIQKLVDFYKEFMPIHRKERDK